MQGLRRGLTDEDEVPARGHVEGHDVAGVGALVHQLSGAVGTRIPPEQLHLAVHPRQQLALQLLGAHTVRMFSDTCNRSEGRGVVF